MKTTFVRAFLALSTLIAAAGLYAQTNTLRVTVPFEFMVNGQKMPSGDYVVAESTENGMLMVYSTDSKHSAIVLSEPSGYQANAHGPALKFERHDGQVYLVRIFTLSGPSRTLPSR